MICPKCQGKGYVEHEHGLIVIECDCDKGRVPDEKPQLPKKVKRGTKRTR